MYFVTLKCFGFVKNLGVLIFMTLVYDNTTCNQAIFTYVFSGQNLSKDKSQGRPKEYYLDELLGFVVYGVYNNRFSCRKLANWINNNDESVNFILNDKKPKKSIINLFLQENTLLINAFFHYTVILGINLGLIEKV